MADSKELISAAEPVSTTNRPIWVPVVSIVALLMAGGSLVLQLMTLPPAAPVMQAADDSLRPQLESLEQQMTFLKNNQPAATPAVDITPLQQRLDMLEQKMIEADIALSEQQQAPSGLDAPSKKMLAFMRLETAFYQGRDYANEVDGFERLQPPSENIQQAIKILRESYNTPDQATLLAQLQQHERAIRRAVRLENTSNVFERIMAELESLIVIRRNTSQPVSTGNDIDDYIKSDVYRALYESVRTNDIMGISNTWQHVPASVQQDLADWKTHVDRRLAAAQVIKNLAVMVFAE